MPRVYLDLNKWVDLARAFAGHPLGERFRPVAAVIAVAVEQGRASFPLSSGHWMETWKQRNAIRRHGLARTMATVSRNHGIASPHRLLPGELDRALKRRFGRPTTLRPLVPFGLGAAHILGDDVPRVSDSARARIGEANPSLGPSELDHLIDAMLLAGPHADLPVDGVPLPPMQSAIDFAEAQSRLAASFAEHGDHKATRRAAIAQIALQDIDDALRDALTHAGISWAEFAALGEDGVTAFMLDLPTRGPGLELMWRLHDNTETNWTPNDMIDIGFLSTAVGYCDIVVTERKWAAMLNQTGVAARAHTIVIHDLADLAALLIDAPQDVGAALPGRASTGTHVR